MSVHTVQGPVTLFDTGQLGASLLTRGSSAEKNLKTNFRNMLQIRPPTAQVLSQMGLN